MKVLVIGRAQNNDIVITDPYVSRTHAQLILHDNGSVSIVDLNSKTGTFVNGIKINGETFLQGTDVVKIGKTIFPWKNHVQNLGETIFDDEQFDDEQFDEYRNIESSRMKKMLIGLLTLLVIGGLAGAGYYFYKNKKNTTNKKQVTSNEEVVEDKDKEDEQEAEDIVISIGDNYQLTLPNGFKEEEGADENVAYQYGNKNRNLKLFIYEVEKDSFVKKQKNKKTKKDKWLALYKDNIVNDLKKQGNLKKIKDLKEEEINGFPAIIVDMVINNETDMRAKRAFIETDNHFYDIYIISSEKKIAKRKLNYKTMDKILHSFQMRTDEDEDGKDSTIEDEEKADD